MGAEDAEFMADVIVDSDLAGHESHGMRRFTEYVQRWRQAGRFVADTQPAIELDRGRHSLGERRQWFRAVGHQQRSQHAVTRAKEWGVRPRCTRYGDRATPGGTQTSASGCQSRCGDPLREDDTSEGQDVGPPGGPITTGHEPDCHRHTTVLELHISCSTCGQASSPPVVSPNGGTEANRLQNRLGERDWHTRLRSAASRDSA